MIHNEYTMQVLLVPLTNNYSKVCRLRNKPKLYYQVLTLHHHNSTVYHNIFTRKQNIPTGYLLTIYSILFHSITAKPSCLLLSFIPHVPFSTSQTKDQNELLINQTLFDTPFFSLTNIMTNQLNIHRKNTGRERIFFIITIVFSTFQ